MFSLRYLAKRWHRWLVKGIERPAVFKNKGVTLLARVFGMVFVKPPSVAFRAHLLNTYALSTDHRRCFMFLILFLQNLSADRGVVRPHVPISLSK